MDRSALAIVAHRGEQVAGNYPATECGDGLALADRLNNKRAPSLFPCQARLRLFVEVAGLGLADDFLVVKAGRDGVAFPFIEFGDVVGALEVPAAETVDQPASLGVAGVAGIFG